LKNFIIGLLILFLTLACNLGRQTQTPSSAIESVSQTETSSPALTSIPELPTVPYTQAECKKRPVAFTNVGLGLPNPSYKLPAIGIVKTAILFADFNDVPASQTPEQIFSLISPNAEKFYRDISYGRMEYVLEPYFTWLRLSQPSSFYGEGIRSYEGHLQFIQEAVTLADANVDFSTFGSILVMIPPEATDVPYGPAFGANSGEGYIADGKVFSNGVTSGADLPGWGFLWLNHETGHIMGFPDLYAYQYDSSNYEDQHRFVGGFGLMGFIAGKAPEFFAFERWQMGWLDDNQIFCQLDGEQTVMLTPIETVDGIKAVMIPVSETKVVVVESRRRLGYDANLVKEGALVYTVDTSIYSGEGPLVIFPRLENDPYRDQSPLAVGESVTVDGVTITVLEATSAVDVVQVTVTK
jgi:M6 family metalloprotease-like protein